MTRFHLFIVIFKVEFQFFEWCSFLGMSQALARLRFSEVVIQADFQVHFSFFVFEISNFMCGKMVLGVYVFHFVEIRVGRSCTIYISNSILSSKI